MTQRPPSAPDLSALSGLATELAATFASIASDVALVIDPEGVIRSVAGGADLAASAQAWVGRPWADTVTGDTRNKVEQLLEEVSDAGVTRRREVNHPAPAGTTIPVTYAAIRLGLGGPVLAVGRDLRAIAAIQQRFVESQQEMERNYWKLRQAESRYRMLFHVATDAVLVAEAKSLRVLDANQAAGELFGRPVDQIVGQPAGACIDGSSRVAVEEVLVTARTSGRPAEIRARLAGRLASVDVSATPMRGDSVPLLLIRARAAQERHGVAGGDKATLAEFVEHTPDAVVISDSIGRVLMANPAFASMCQVHDETQLKGRPLSDWLVDGPAGLEALLVQVRQHGIVPRARVDLGAGRDTAVAVELSAALLAEGDQECIGFTLRRHEPAVASGLPLVDEFADAIRRVTEQLGNVSLPRLVREATELAEGHLIRLAVDRSGGDVAQAAEVLGISIDSLLLRMRRHGLGVSIRGREPANERSITEPAPE